MVDQSVAASDLAANVSVLRTADQMSKTLLRLGDR
jgi:hypothetical protein